MDNLGHRIGLFGCYLSQQCSYLSLVLPLSGYPLTYITDSHYASSETRDSHYPITCELYRIISSKEFNSKAQVIENMSNTLYFLSLSYVKL